MVNVMLKDAVTVRKGNSNDLNFIYATMLQGLYYGNTFYGKIDKEAFFDSYNQVLKSLIMKPTTDIKVLCLTEDEDVILGYSISSPQALHYVFVKQAWRRRGFAKDLTVGSLNKPVTHITDDTESIRLKMRLTYNPFLI